MNQLFQTNKSNPWFWAFIALAAIFLASMLIMSQSAGNSGDEDGFQIPQAKNVINYYKTSGEDTTCMTFQNLKYYGSSPDVIVQFVNQTIGIDNVNQTRHFFNSFLGWLAILVAGLLAYSLGGWRAGVITMVLFFLSPRFLGHSFNNPKDIPFATATIAAIYFVILFFKQFPKVKWYTIVLLIISIAFAISVRVGGVLLYAYFGLFGLVYLLIGLKGKEVKRLKEIKTTSKLYTLNSKLLTLFIYGTGIALVSFFLGILLWPFAMQAPIKHTLEAFAEMSNFAVGIRQLFEGQLTWSDMLPWYYTPKFILMTIPVAVLIGLVLFFTLIWKDKKNYFNYFIIFFTFFFPVFWIVYTGANVYGGWRHAIFAYPTMVVSAGIGFNLLVEWVEKKLQPQLQ